METDDLSLSGFMCGHVNEFVIFLFFFSSFVFSLLYICILLYIKTSFLQNIVLNSSVMVKQDMLFEIIFAEIIIYVQFVMRSEDYSRSEKLTVNINQINNKIKP